MQQSPINLPAGTEAKEQLIQELEGHLKRLHEQQDQQPVEQGHQWVERLELRIRLIKNCQQLGLLRLTHLEEIFKHYCTHIFKTGKHMTFERLEYERVHLTMDRFFLFLKDFGLTMMRNENDKKPKEVIQKNTIITIFKKISSNSRDISFEEFIQCLETIAAAYFHEKSNYPQRLQAERQARIKLKHELERRKQRRAKLNEQIASSTNEATQPKLEQQSPAENNAEVVEKEPAEEEEEIEQGEEEQLNDDLVRQMMEDQSIVDPTNELKGADSRVQNVAITFDKTLLELTNQEMIEYYYQMIGVDSTVDYRTKLTQLNLLVFKKGANAQNETEHKQPKSDHSIEMASQQQPPDERTARLKEMLQQKREREKKAAIPKPKAMEESETARKRRQMKQMREEKVAESKVETQSNNNSKNAAVRKVDFSQKELSWGTIEKLTLEQLKLRQFNPAKLFTPQEDDDIFLEEYGGTNTRKKNPLAVRDKQSQQVVTNAKKRAFEVEKHEQIQQNELDMKSRRLNKVQR